jgi:2-methylcitrate dehydratase PrpD
MGPTEAIANFVTRTASEDIPPEVFQHAKRHVIDTLGVAIGASSGPLAAKLATLVAGQKEGEAMLWNGNGKTTASEAAWVNGTLAHALDFDDGGVALTPMHPSSPVLAAIWALSESRNLSGRDALCGYIVGLEVECKIASAISLSHYDHGWHATPVIGVLGAVAGTSWLAQLNVDQICNAIGVAASLAGGLQANFGTMTKPLHAGIACRNGLMATLLTEAGWTANPAILDTDKGFFKVFNCGEIKDLNTFGKPFHFLSPGVSIKRFPTCAATHLGIEALLALKRDHALTADQVESIECSVHALSVQALRQEPEVRTAEAARFSLHFAAAMVLLEGSVELKHFSQTTFMRENVRALMKRVRVSVHPELRDLESKKRNFAEVIVHRKDGSATSKRETQIRGRAPLLLDDSEVDAKFRGCTEPVLGETNSQSLLEKLHNLESVKELKTLLAAACGPAWFAKRISSID